MVEHLLLLHAVYKGCGCEQRHTLARFLVKPECHVEKSEQLEKCWWLQCDQKWAPSQTLKLCCFYGSTWACLSSLPLAVKQMNECLKCRSRPFSYWRARSFSEQFQGIPVASVMDWTPVYSLFYCLLLFPAASWGFWKIYLSIYGSIAPGKETLSP